MSPLLPLLALAALASAQTDACKDKYTDQASCDADASCTWCKAAAVPSACFETTNAKKLPPGVFVCDGSGEEDESAVSASPYTFLSLGDWGGGALKSPSYTAKQNVYDVAKAMETVAATTNPQFMLNTGDNFYWCGIQNTSDFQVAADWLDPYKPLNLDWYSILGNHEYGYNVSAQLDLANVHANWIMDDRYYSKRIQVTSDVAISMIFLDTSPCVSEYRSSSSEGWDPCGSAYPTCSLSSNPKDQFEGPCKFNENILSQQCGPRLTWFKETLAAVPEGDWLIVAGHHPLTELDVADFVTPLQSHGFDLYLNGHAHTLSQYTVDGAGAYVTTGAGSLVNTEDQKGGTPAKESTLSKVLGKKHLEEAFGHTYQTVWNEKVAGFTQHSFNEDYTELTTDFYSYQGTKIHSFTVTKGAPPTPPPTPSSPPTPGGGGSCCHFSDSSCSEGDVCCKSSCNDPSTCSYSESGCSGYYGKLHNCLWSGSRCVVGSSSTVTTGSNEL